MKVAELPPADDIEYSTPPDDSAREIGDASSHPQSSETLRALMAYRRGDNSNRRQAK